MTTENPMINMLYSLHNQIFSRMYEGKVNFPKDIDMLRTHIKTALEIGEPIVAARFLTTIGTIYSNIGYLDKALASYDEAFSLFEAQNSPNHMAGVLNNIALVHRYRGHFEAGLNNIDRAVQIMQDADIIIPPFSMLLATQGILLTLLGRYAEAETVFLRSHELYAEYDRANLNEKQKRAGVDAHLDTLHGLAKVHLHFKRFPEAWKSIKLAEELAQSTRNNMELTAIYLTQANIASQDSSHEQSYEVYIERCNAVMDGIKLPILGARILLEAARYQFAVDNTELARRYANAAQNYFDQADVEEERHFATEILDQL